MKATRILNNNAVCASAEDGRELVLTGSGIGFGLRPGDAVDESRIEKTFLVQDELRQRLLELLDGIDIRLLEITQDIIDYAKGLGVDPKDQVLVALADHIGFAVERARSGIQLPPLLIVSDIKLSYPKEYAAGEWGRARVGEACGVELPSDEAAYIALQLVNAAMDQPDAVRMLGCITDILHIIEERLGAVLDQGSLATARLVTHVRFLVQRVFGDVQWQEDDIGDLRDYLLARNPGHAACVEDIRRYLEEEHGYRLHGNEEAYLLVHLGRIFGTNANGKEV